MIVTKTPMRISFFSGGSDLPAFFHNHGVGRAFSAAIDKYIYVCIHDNKHRGIKVMYQDVQRGEHVEHLNNALVKHSLEYFGFDTDIQIGSFSDVPAGGSGLGSSSAFVVGLVHGLYTKKFNTPVSDKSILFNIAQQIEIEKCNYPVGYQDQIPAALGGVNLLTFSSRDNKQPVINVDRVEFSDKWIEFADHLVLLYTGISRDANKILTGHTKVLTQLTDPDNEKIKLMRNGATNALECFKALDRRDYRFIGDLLNLAWEQKKKISDQISGDQIDELYDLCIRAGGWGGKILGAGGGGFMIFITDKNNRENLISNAEQRPGVFGSTVNFVNQGSTLLVN